MTDVFFDAEVRYRDACERRQVALEAWEAEGRPLLAPGSMGQPTEHPLVRQLNELDRLCDKLAQPLFPARTPGRKAVAVVAPAITPSPAARLRTKRRGSVQIASGSGGTPRG